MSSAHVTVYQVLDSVMRTKAVPPGTLGRIHSAVDALRLAAPSGEHLRQAEQISVTMHKLELALRRTDPECESAARKDLRALAAAWLQTRIGRVSPTA